MVGGGGVLGAADGADPIGPHPHCVTRALDSAPRKTLQLYHLTVTCGPGA